MKSFEEELQNFQDRAQTVYGAQITVAAKEDDEQLQRTEKWRKDRSENYTGSENDKLMTTKIRATKNNPKDWRVRSWICSFGDMAFSYILEKAIEKATGEPKRDVRSPYFDWGNDHEDTGRDLAAEKLGVTIEEIGFLKFMRNGGASPDGVMNYKGYKRAFELKCPATQLKHYKHLNNPIDEKHDYFWQVQSEMLALKCRKVVFATYDPSFPESCRLGIKYGDISPIHCRALMIRCIIGERMIRDIIASNFTCDMQGALERATADIPSDYMGIKKWFKLNR